MQINTTNDWMLALAEALRTGDVEAVGTLGDISQGWLQTNEELTAQQALVDAIMDSLVP